MGAFGISMMDANMQEYQNLGSNSGQRNFGGTDTGMLAISQRFKSVGGRQSSSGNVS